MKHASARKPEASSRMARDMIEAARRAGEAILEVREAGFGVDRKQDRSPVTEADRRAHRIITGFLGARWPNIPLLSEEGSHQPHAKRAGWREFFLVDPLDGTAEFVRGGEEFCVCIALIRERVPALGVIFAPVSGELHWGGPGHGAFRRGDSEPATPVAVRRPDPEAGLTALTSRLRSDPEMENRLEGRNVREVLRVSSAIKFCMLADGRADVYANFNPTWEWDTAAGQAIVTGAGGSVTRIDGFPLLCNKPDLRNPPFVALAHVSLFGFIGNG